MVDIIVSFALICGLAGIAYAIATAVWVLKQDAGTERMQQISNAIKEGAKAFLHREYKAVFVVGIALFVVLWYFLGKWTAIGFAIGAAGSALAGYIGMMVTVRANVRTAQAASKGLKSALNLAFKITAYAVPLAAMLFAGSLAQWKFGSDLATMAATVAGLVIGLVISRVEAGRLHSRGELAPLFLRRARPGETCNS